MNVPDGNPRAAYELQQRQNNSVLAFSITPVSESVQSWIGEFEMDRLMAMDHVLNARALI
jgi:hypothetical protein